MLLHSVGIQTNVKQILDNENYQSEGTETGSVQEAPPPPLQKGNENKTNNLKV